MVPLAAGKGRSGGWVKGIKQNSTWRLRFVDLTEPTRRRLPRRQISGTASGNQFGRLWRVFLLFDRAFLGAFGKLRI